MPPDISEIDADIRKHSHLDFVCDPNSLYVCVTVDKISALTPDSFLQYGGGEPVFSPRSQNPFGYGREMWLYFYKF